jgi:hypothetical protein
MPHRYSVGIEHVILRGEFVLKAGKMTGRLPGRPVLSVPVALTPATKLRRELLNLLSRHDGRFGLYAEIAGGKESMAINADDPFAIDSIEGVALPAPKVTLRELARMLVKAEQKVLVVRSKAGAEQPFSLLFQPIALPNGRNCFICLAYDKQLGDECETLAQLIRAQFLNHLPE